MIKSELLDATRRLLNERPHYVTYPRIKADTKIPIHWLSKLSVNTNTKTYNLEHLENLYRYLSKKESIFSTSE